MISWCKDQIVKLLLQLFVALSQPPILEPQERHRLPQMPGRFWEGWAFLWVANGLVHPEVLKRSTPEAAPKCQIICSGLFMKSTPGCQRDASGSMDPSQPIGPCQQL